MCIGVKTVKALKDYRLLLTFDNGEQRIFNVEPYLNKGRFQELRDTSLFDSVRVSFDTVEWSNGLDLCPETLYAESVPAETESAAAASS